MIECNSEAALYDFLEANLGVTKPVFVSIWVPSIEPRPIWTRKEVLECEMTGKLEE